MRFSRVMKLWFWIVCLFLSGCSVSKSHFDCSFEKGVGCHSISEVNKMIDQGNLHSKKVKNVRKNRMSNHFSEDEGVISQSGMVSRVSEQHIKVWIAPHEDDKGNFLEATVVHSVLKPGTWRFKEYD